MTPHRSFSGQQNAALYKLTDSKLARNVSNLSFLWLKKYFTLEDLERDAEKTNFVYFNLSHFRSYFHFM